MPFIWDDNDWQLINDGEEYDRSLFAVVRKLFIQLKENPNAEHGVRPLLQLLLQIVFICSFEF